MPNLNEIISVNTTNKHFELFKNHFLKWIKVYGLNEFRYHFEHLDSSEMDGNDARVIGLNSQKMFMVDFSKNFVGITSVYIDYIKYIAWHEATDCLLYKIRELARAREYNEEQMDSEIHGIINRLEPLIYKGKK